MKEQLVYCIIATYNGMQWIERCLNSLEASSQKSYIIVVDNDSKDRTTFFIKENYPTVEVIETGKNLGFGQANNIGLKLALERKADYVFLLNQDAWVETDTIARLISAHIENPSLGIVSPIHLNGAGNELDDIFYLYLLKSDIKELISSNFFNKPLAKPVIDTVFINAAAWLISKDCLEKTGGFDPIFFHYGEDDNYAHRVLYKGFKIGILTTTKIYHDKDYAQAKKTADIKKIFKRDWIIFLHQACNIQNQNYKSLVARRFCRYAFLTLLSLVTFRKDAAVYNFSMVKNILLAFNKIKKSRKTAINAATPYLV